MHYVFEDEELCLEALWSPDYSQGSQSFLANFGQYISGKYLISFGSDAFDQSYYRDFHRWSVEHIDLFWDEFWDFSGVVGEKGGAVLEQTDRVPWSRFFPRGALSYSENMLSYWIDHPEQAAIIYRHQDGPDRVLSGRDLCDSVSVWVQALQRAGVGVGDHVAVYLSNVPESDIILLAASHIGAIFCSAGMEMGGDDMVGRLGAVKPKILIAAQEYKNGEKVLSRCAVLERAQSDISSLETIVLLPFGSTEDDNLCMRDGFVSCDDFLARLFPQPLVFERRDFNHPLYVLFSSGSTGAPKCFVHSTGGVLLKHLSEYFFHCDVREGDRVFYHATPSWMMWNWLSSCLAVGATMLKYDGHPFYPDAYAQLKFTTDHGCTHHGNAAPVIMGWMEAGVRVCDEADYDLSSMRTLMYTGAILPPAGFEYVHEHIKSDMQISGIAGGTDIVGCFLSGNPLSDVYAGQIAAPLMGMDVQIWNEDGQQVQAGETGELVCCAPFPSMPLCFLGDENGSRYRDAYFDYYVDESRSIWCHGDSVRQTAQGQYLIIGRSDATLNQNGVRIGPVLLYDQMVGFSNDVRASMAVDFVRPDSKQSIIVLFVVLDGYEHGVPEALTKDICRAIKDNVGPYSIPTEIIAAPDVLRTKNGKLAEVVAKKILQGKAVPNASLYGVDLVKFYQDIAQDLQTRYGG